MKQSTHNTSEEPDKPCTKSSKKYKKNKLKDYKYTVIRKEPHKFFKWFMEQHFVKLVDAENELRKWNNMFGRQRDEYELIMYQEYLDRKAKGVYNEP